MVQLRWIFSVIRRWLWLIAGCGVLGAAIAFLVISRATPVYTTSATLLVRAAPGTDTGDYNAIRGSELLAGTYSQMLRGQAVMEAVITRLGLDEAPDALAKKVQVTLIQETQLIQLRVEHTDPAQAALIANTIAETFIDQIRVLGDARYADSLARMREESNELSALIEETQADIDTLRIETAQKQADLQRLEILMAEYRDTNRALQQDYDGMRLAADQTTGDVVVLERAEMPEGMVRSPYTSSLTTTLMIYQAPPAGNRDYNAILAGERLARTYSQMLTGQTVMEATIARLGLAETPDELASRLQAESVPETQLIRLGVAHPDPAQAVLIANTVAEVFISQVQALQAKLYVTPLANMREQIDDLAASIEETEAGMTTLRAETIKGQTRLARLETLLAEYRDTYRVFQQDYDTMRLTAAQSRENVDIVETAKAPRKPISSNTRTLYITLAILVGAIVGGGVAFGVEYLDDTIKTPEDIGRVLSLGTLGEIGRLAKKQEELVVVAQPSSPDAEAFRILCTNTRFASVDDPLQTLLVTSPGPLEGKSLVAANLAVAMAQAGLRVIAVDADLRRPRLAELFGLDPRLPGLTGALLEGTIDGMTQPTQQAGLSALPSGRLPPNPAEMVGSQLMQRLLRELAQQADLVLIDSPPVLRLSDAPALAQAVDGTLLVINAGKTRREAARHAVESLHQVGANIVGVVLNAVPTRKGSSRYSTYYQYSGNRSGKHGHRTRSQKGSQMALQRLLGRRLSP
jgi:succinoglycan biosynthesis transport protein ExoP